MLRPPNAVQLTRTHSEALISSVTAYMCIAHAPLCRHSKHRQEGQPSAAADLNGAALQTSRSSIMVLSEARQLFSAN